MVYRIKQALLIFWGFLVTLAFTPVAVLFWGNTTVSWLYARVLGRVGLMILGIRLDVEGREYLDTHPCIILANHQSNFDIIWHGSLFPRHTVVIGKKELWKIPLFGLFFAATGNILIDRTSRTQSVAGLDQAVRALRERNVNIWIFPEGTRSHGQSMGTFKKGGFHMAVAAQAPLVCVVLDPITEVLDTARHRAPGGRIRVRILPPVSTVGLTVSQVDDLRRDMEARFHAALGTPI